jgi:hypothetical protein
MRCHDSDSSRVRASRAEHCSASGEVEPWHACMVRPATRTRPAERRQSRRQAQRRRAVFPRSASGGGAGHGRHTVDNSPWRAANRAANNSCSEFATSARFHDSSRPRRTTWRGVGSDRAAIEPPSATTGVFAPNSTLPDRTIHVGHTSGAGKHRLRQFSILAVFSDLSHDVRCVPSLAVTIWPPAAQKFR